MIRKSDACYTRCDTAAHQIGGVAQAALAAGHDVPPHPPLPAAALSLRAHAVCQPGFGGAGCSECRFSTFSAGGNATSPTPACENCPTGKTTKSTGTNSSAGCVGEELNCARSTRALCARASTHGSVMRGHTCCLRHPTSMHCHTRHQASQFKSSATARLSCSPLPQPPLSSAQPEWVVPCASPVLSTRGQLGVTPYSRKCAPIVPLERPLPALLAPTRPRAAYVSEGRRMLVWKERKWVEAAEARCVQSRNRRHVHAPSA